MRNSLQIVADAVVQHNDHITFSRKRSRFEILKENKQNDQRNWENIENSMKKHLELETHQLSNKNDKLKIVHLQSSKNSSTSTRPTHHSLLSDEFLREDVGIFCSNVINSFQLKMRI